jgi:hypothetical protein
MSDREPDIGEDQEDIRVKVTDRRKFRKDGELRDEAAVQAEEEAPPPATAAKAKGEDPEEVPRKPAAGEGPGGPRKQAQGGVDFQSFVYFLYMSALHELGVPTQPGEPGRPADLERARFFVDVLQLLEGKTAGNLEPGETKLLEEALYNLRMQYVGVSQGRSG